MVGPILGLDGPILILREDHAEENKGITVTLLRKRKRKE
jgi:hypothetical protein